MNRCEIMKKFLDRPLLQLAVDTESLEEAFSLIELVYPHFDIVEVGTPLMMAEGVRAVSEIKKRWPDKVCLADAKIMDAGKMEAAIVFESDADIVTVLGCSDDSTIAGVVEAAKENNGCVMADLINCADLASRAKKLAELGVDILCVHAAVDSGSGADSLFSELIKVRKAVETPLAIAGGINSDTLRDALSAGANIVVVGGAISRAKSPSEVAASMVGTLLEVGKNPVESGTPAVESPSEVMSMVSREISGCTAMIDAASVSALMDEIEGAGRIFCAAAGRSGLAMRGFAMRLMHMGRRVHVVGDVTTPSIAAGDLLLIGSGSGSTASLVQTAGKAKSIGTRIALITIDPSSPIGEMADCVVRIPAPSPKARAGVDSVSSAQPMGSLFEQSMNILFDSTVMLLMERGGLDSAAMFTRHANLE